MLLITKGYGFTVDDIDWSCPADLEPYRKAYELKIKQQDYINWLSNQYTLSAVSVAVEHCLAGRKTKSKYIEKPILSEIEEKKQETNKILTEEDKKKQTEKLFMQLKIMGANFGLKKEVNK